MIKMLRLIRWAALGLIVLLAIGVAVFEFSPGGRWTRPPAKDASAGTVSVPGGVPIGGPFHLIDDKRHSVTDADYRGRWMLGSGLI
jgi:cytochrome oxidase Cu insertion factor (SCO1/SenC/PrrC family)